MSMTGRYLRVSPEAIERAFADPAGLTDWLYSEEATEHFARSIWENINLVNLHDNIGPTEGRAHLVLEKGSDHAIRRVRLRKL